MASKKKKVTRKPAKKAAKKRKVAVRSTSTSTTKKRKKSAKKRKPTVKSTSTSAPSRKKTGKKAGRRVARKFGNKKGKAWSAFMSAESGVARPVSGPMTPAAAKANSKLMKRIAAANKAIKNAHEKIAAAKPERTTTKRKTKKKAGRRKYSNKSGKAWTGFMSKERKVKRAVQGPVRPPSGTSKGRKPAKKARKAPARVEKTITTADVLKGAKSYKMKAWLCVGKTRTGCGGGKKGGHVLASL